MDANGNIILSGEIPHLFQPTKARYLELNQLANEIYKKMNELGIKKEEYCYFGSIMQRIIQLPD
jgi:hypothetical protein